MRLSEILVVYLCAGCAVAAASRGARRWVAIALWPLVLPSLLAPEQRFDTAPPATPALVPEVDAALQRVRAALALWDAAPPVPLDALKRALYDLAARRDALAALLARPEYREPAGADPSAQQRRANIAALARLEHQLGLELAGAIGRLDELVTRIQLAVYGGAPLGDLGEQLASLIAAVEAQAEVAQSSGG